MYSIKYKACKTEFNICRIKTRVKEHRLFTTLNKLAATTFSKKATSVFRKHTNPILQILQYAQKAT